MKITFGKETRFVAQIMLEANYYILAKYNKCHKQTNRHNEGIFDQIHDNIIICCL